MGFDFAGFYSRFNSVDDKPDRKNWDLHGRSVIVNLPHPGPPPKFPEPKTEFTEEGILKGIPTPEELAVKDLGHSEQDDLAFADRIVSHLFTPANQAKFAAIGEICAYITVNPGDSVDGGFAEAERLMQKKGWVLTVPIRMTGPGLTVFAYQADDEHLDDPDSDGDSSDNGDEDDEDERRDLITKALNDIWGPARRDRPMLLAEIDEEAS